MYNCVDMHITEEGMVFIKLIKKTPENTFGDRIYRIDLNNRRGDALYGSALTYSRHGDMLIGTITLPKSRFTQIGSFVFDDWYDKGIKGNIRGCY